MVASAHSYFIKHDNQNNILLRIIIDMENDCRKQPLKYIVAFCIALTTVYAKEIV